jgi:hypothetical protein
LLGKDVPCIECCIVVAKTIFTILLSTFGHNLSKGTGIEIINDFVFIGNNTFPYFWSFGAEFV